MTRKIEISTATAQELIKLAVIHEKYEVIEALAKALNEPVIKVVKLPVVKKKRGRKAKAKVENFPILEATPVETTSADKVEEIKAKKREYMRARRAKKEKKNGE